MQRSNDSNNNIHPNAHEIHNWLDDDCDSQVDDSLRFAFYNDSDYGDFDLPFIKAHSTTAGLETSANDSGDRYSGLLSEKMEVDLSGPPSIAVFPNPVFSSTTISFYLKKTSPVLIELLDVNGRNAIIIGKGDFPAGNQAIILHRRSLAAGIYFLQLKTGEGVMMKKLFFE